ncbi:MAG: YHS domain-containing protein [Candidatus Omnitrophota bacterium]|nr:YHS domain-containing protein [Candidatus Omnitrophota bacterium]MDZ4242977.1 YHS domain-containing protein [Candidatus Omnitrophota bacterium]
MKNALMMMALLAVLAVPSLALAEEGEHVGHDHGAAAAEEAPAVPSAAVDVGNKICPVSGHKIGGMGDPVKYEHQGKVYNFCCKMCLTDFQKDPEKYIEKVNEELKGNK